MKLVTGDKTLHCEVEKCWEVEGFGTKNTLKTRTDGEADCRYRDPLLSREDMRALGILEKTMQLTADDQHETGLRDYVQVRNNQREAEMRLEGLRRKFHRDSSV